MDLMEYKFYRNPQSGIQNPRLSWIKLVPRVLSWRENLGTRLVLDYPGFNPGLPYVGRNGEEKSSRHVAIVAKFLDENKPIKSFKILFALFHTSPILFNFI